MSEQNLRVAYRRYYQTPQGDTPHEALKETWEAKQQMEAAEAAYYHARHDAGASDDEIGQDIARISAEERDQIEGEEP